MKLILQNNRIAGTATDEYAGPDQHMAAPPDFDVSRMGDYLYVNSVLVLLSSTRIAKLAFRNRFTQAEKVTMELASLDSPSAPMAQRQQAAALRVSLADMAAAEFIDLARADTRTGVQMLETAEILATGRALQILDAPVQAEERLL